MRNLIFWTVATVAFMACSSSKTPASQAVQGEEAYKTLAKEKLTSPITYTFNEDSSRVLCTHAESSSPQQPRVPVNYIVITISTNQVVFESTVSGGSVKWYDLSHLAVFTTPGYMRNDQTKDDYTRILDLETKEFVPKTSLINKEN